MPRILLSIIGAVLFASSLSGQVAQWPPVPPFSDQTRPTARDPKALTIIQAAITALGGSSIIGQTQTWQIQGQVQGSNQNSNKSGTVTWEMAGSEYSMMSTVNGVTHSILTGHGKPSSVANGVATPLPVPVIHALFVPALVGPLLVQESQNKNYSIESGGTIALGSTAVDVVTTSLRIDQMDALVTPQTWYFDSATHLPVRVEFRLPANSGPRLYIGATADFSSYRNIAGTLYPFQIVSSRLGKQTDVVTLQNLNVNAPIPASDFDPPSGGAQ